MTMFGLSSAEIIEGIPNRLKTSVCRMYRNLMITFEI